MIVPPLIYILSALHYYIYDKPLVGNVAKFVWLRHQRNPGTLASGGSRKREFVRWTTSLGRMRGTQEFSRTGYPYAWFRAIPYAKAPVGELRYESPVEHEGWEGELDATMFGSECLQYNLFTRRINGNEDCLFMNIATRMPPEQGPGEGKNNGAYPVIFFIHGGLFMFGQANPFGPRYFMDEPVVFVSINYRLNSFGFLNTGDGVVQGNMGLKDQVFALQWVKKHISYFNGDPQRVTLIGESAGAVCVHLLTMSPLSRGLFAGAVSLSGTAVAPWGHITNFAEQALEFGEGLGCPTPGSNETTEGMVQCLKSLDGEQVASYHRGAIISAAQGKNSLFTPTVDSGPSDQAFLPDLPLELLRSGKVSDRPWITGVNSGDGLVYLIPILRNDTMRQLLNSQWSHYAPQLLSYRDHENPEGVTQNVSKYYLNNEGVSQENILNANDMLSDRGFFLDSHDIAILQSQKAPTYIYYYTYEGVFNGGNILYTKANVPGLPSDQQYLLGGAWVWIRSIITNRPQQAKFGICHGDEMPLLFNVPYVRREVIPGDADFEFSRLLVRIFVSFAQHGIPDTSQSGVRWDPVNASATAFLNKDSSTRRIQDGSLKRLLLDRELAIIDEPFYERIRFWKNHSISYLPSS